MYRSGNRDGRESLSKTEEQQYRVLFHVWPVLYGDNEVETFEDVETARKRACYNIASNYHMVTTFLHLDKEI